MLGALCFLGNGECAAEERLGGVILALFLQQDREVVESCAGRRMLGALCFLGDGESKFGELEREGVTEAPGIG